MNAVDWSEFEQDPEDPVLDASFCLRCRYSECTAQAAGTGNQEWKNLREYEQANRYQVHKFVFVRGVQKIYDRGIRFHLTDDLGRRLTTDTGEPIVQEDGTVTRDPGPWPAQQIWEHQTKHAFDPEALMAENAIMAQDILRATADCIASYDDTLRRYTVDPKLQKLWSDLEKNTARPLLKELASKKRPAAGAGGGSS